MVLWDAGGAGGGSGGSAGPATGAGAAAMALDEDPPPKYVAQAGGGVVPRREHKNCELCEWRRESWALPRAATVPDQRGEHTERTNAQEMTVCVGLLPSPTMTGKNDPTGCNCWSLLRSVERHCRPTRSTAWRHAQQRQHAASSLPACGTGGSTHSSVAAPCPTPILPLLAPQCMPCPCQPD